MMQLCPKCNSARFYYVQEVTEYHLVEVVYDDGNVDLGLLDDTKAHDDDYKLQCEDCEWSGTTAEFLELFPRKKEG